MEPVRADTIEMVFGRIENGFVFERLAQRLMGALLETEFVPVGGHHDRGIDGLEYTSLHHSSRLVKTVHQFSIDKQPKPKIRHTIEILRANDVQFDNLAYSTSIIVKNLDAIQEQMLAEFNVHVQIRDINWFKVHVNNSPRAQRAFHEFIEENLPQYSRLASGFDLINVPNSKVYIYLRQTIEDPQSAESLKDVLIDTLIFLGLEGTDSTLGILRSKSEVLGLIGSISHFDPVWLEENVDRRLRTLSAKPLRKIKHHRQPDKYCLPYDTRLRLAESQDADSRLYEEFKSQVVDDLRSQLNRHGVSVRSPLALLEGTFHEVYSQQGLEFAEFIENGDSSDVIDKSLADIVARVVDASQVIKVNRTKVKQALLQCIRGIVYDGTEVQHEYLSKLSSTYRLLFLLQVDPHLADYFENLVRDLTVYVDTSIVIPAMAEYFLRRPHQRYSNLLRTANEVGIKLVITKPAIDELAAHMSNVQRTYLARYEGRDQIYLNETSLAYVPEIMIRAYFYARMHGAVEDFIGFYETFVSWRRGDTIVDLVMWLRHAYGIQYEVDDGDFDPEEEDTLVEILSNYKGSEQQARNDAKQLLHIYRVREARNELGTGGVFGYRTWWLTSDTISQRAFASIHRDSTRRNPYIRADFLYNYIMLAPSRKRARAIFRQLFPTLLGVNVSFHIPDEICNAVQEHMVRFRHIAHTPRFQAIIRSLNESLIGEPERMDRGQIESWFDQREREIRSVNGLPSVGGGAGS